jgi:hypothetical protein
MMNQTHDTVTRDLAPVWQALAEAGRTAGVDPYALAALAASESGLDPAARSEHSRAQGLFQFMPKTWDTLLLRYGLECGVERTASRLDARAAALMAACLYRESQATLAAKLHRPIALADIKVAHVLGTGQAVRFLQQLQKTPDLAATACVPARVVQANHGIFYNLKTGIANTLKEVFDRFKIDLHVKLDWMHKNFSLDLTLDKPGSEPAKTSPSQEQGSGQGQSRVDNWSRDQPAPDRSVATQPEIGLAL